MSLQTEVVRVPITKPFLDEKEERAIVEVLRSGWVAQGPRVAEFERLVALHVGARHAVATSNCTTALHLALTLVGIGPGDEVIVPSFSFIATANAVRHTGATPVFVDIDPRTYNMDPAGIEPAITPRTKAVMPVHQLGLAADMDRINAVARARGLTVVEDAAPAIGATCKGKRVGALGNITCFSFHPRKVITTGEGGMIVTDDAAVAERARALRSHGMSVSDLARHQARRVVIEEYLELGYNYRLSDLQAAVGIEQLAKLDLVLARRRRLAERYNEALARLPCVQRPFSSSDTPHTYQSYMIALRPGAPKSREQVMEDLLAAGVATRRGVMAIHLEPCYARGNGGPVRLPVTEAAARDTLLLPIYAGMADAEQEYVLQNLERVLRR